jgi:hypothetical protein
MREAARDSDLFPDERVAGELIARLSELSTRLRQGATRRAVSALLDTASTVAAARGGGHRATPLQVIKRG